MGSSSAMKPKVVRGKICGLYHKNYNGKKTNQYLFSFISEKEYYYFIHVYQNLVEK